MGVQVINRMNSDRVAMARERNKAIADILLSRSDGRLKSAKPTFEQTLRERELRGKAQQVNSVNSVMQGLHVPLRREGGGGAQRSRSGGARRSRCGLDQTPEGTN